MSKASTTRSPASNAGAPQTDRSGRQRPDLFIVRSPDAAQQPSARSRASSTRYALRRDALMIRGTSFWMHLGLGSAVHRRTLHRVRDTRANVLSPLHRARGRAVTMNQVGKIETGNGAVAHHPVAANHHAIGAMRTAQHQRRQGVAMARETQLVELEQRQIRHFTDRDLAEFGPADA